MYICITKNEQKMTFEQRIQAFEILRDKLDFLLKMDSLDLQKKNENNPLLDAIELQYQKNPWFTPFFCNTAIRAIIDMLQSSDIQMYKDKYTPLVVSENKKIETILVISAGNIPLAAFHDFFSVLVSGNRFLGKLSANDSVLLPFIADLLIEIEPSFKDYILFSLESKSLKNANQTFDKVISTGSNNSARYFDYYFAKYPKIIRKNRNSIAVLSGNESEEELNSLCNDIFYYFGLGCRSVSKIFVPKNYNFIPFIETIIQNSSYLCDHHLYLNNLEYQKTMHLMNKKPFYDAGTIMLVENEALHSPIAILNYEFYDQINQVKHKIGSEINDIQCIALTKDHEFYHNSSFHSIVTSFGSTQKPTLLDYPDGIDIVKFCIS